MSLTSILGIMLIGVLAGLLSGLVGVGGGIIIVPALVMLLGLSQHTAQGTTLAMLSFPVSLIGALNYYKKGMVDWKVALILCIPFMIGGFVGSKIALELSTPMVKKIFAMVMILVAVKILFLDKN